MNMRKTVVLNAVGLTPDLLGPSTPRLCAFAEQGKRASINTVLPAVTCSVQATLLTGRYTNGHGIVGNGWYFRDECEVKFWRQSNALIQGPKVWETARSLDPTFTCANLFWWFNMYASVDYAVTPRPMYPAEGSRISIPGLRTCASRSKTNWAHSRSSTSGVPTPRLVRARGSRRLQSGWTSAMTQRSP